VDGYLIITLVVKAGDDPARARSNAIGWLNEWVTDRTLGGFDGEPNRPGALLHYSVHDESEDGALIAQAAVMVSDGMHAAACKAFDDTLAWLGPQSDRSALRAAVKAALNYSA
jgi:hypothetical protein